MVEQIDAQDRQLIPSQGGRNSVVFTNFHETYSGTSSNGRRWVISPTLTGWRLEFRDPGDVQATYAGTHATLRAAQQEACADYIENCRRSVT